MINIDDYEEYYSPGVTATIGKTGKLYFGKNTVNKYGLKKFKCATLLKNTKTPNIDFAIVFHEESTHGSVALSFRNDAATLPLKNFLNDYNIDFSSKIELSVETDDSIQNTLFLFAVNGA